MKPLVYIAGPYTDPDPIANTHDALAAASPLFDEGLCIPIVPHLTLFMQPYCPRPVEDWYAYDIEILRRCDGLYRLVGASVGAEREIQFAEENGIPVFSSRIALREWAKAWKAPE